MSTGDSKQNASSFSSVPGYAPIQPRGDPDEHRQAMAEEKDIQNSHIVSERRRRNTQAAARMRERQKEREKCLIEQRDQLLSQMKKLEEELVAIRAQRQQSKVEDTVHEKYEALVQKLSAELETANIAMNSIVEEVKKLVEIVKLIDV
ncbi:hypothetical protein J3B02_001281 [Coemansia erecta]|nr:hypothetical protein J3B02_001281 [Coemansia erecta]